MLSGEIKIHDQPTSYKSNTGNSGTFYSEMEDWFPYQSSTPASTKYAEIQKAMNDAKAAGFNIGVKVKRKNQSIINNVGIIVGYELTLSRGTNVHGKPQPILVSWDLIHKKHDIPYAQDELELYEEPQHGC